MSFLGKILVVVQLVLSILFMSFAGAVFTVQTNFKEKYEASLKDVDKEKKRADAAVQERQKADLANKAELETSNTQAQKAQGDNAILNNQVVASKKAAEQFEQKIQTQTALSATAADEAEHRHAEALKQHVANVELHQTLDETAKELTARNNELFAMDKELRQLKFKYTGSMERVALLEKVVQKHGFSTDPRELGDQKPLIPTVEGVIKSVKKDKTDRPEFVQITLGSDDGLAVGHMMNVIRTGVDGKKPEFLGKIRLTTVDAQTAVGQVINPSKNVVIEMGDVVSTKK